MLPGTVVTGTPNGVWGVLTIGHPDGGFHFESEGLTRWARRGGVGLDLGATWTAIENWYNQNEQTIDEVVEVVGAITGAVAS